MPYRHQIDAPHHHIRTSLQTPTRYVRSNGNDPLTSFVVSYVAHLVPTTAVDMHKSTTPRPRLLLLGPCSAGVAVDPMRRFRRPLRDVAFFKGCGAWWPCIQQPEFAKSRPQRNRAVCPEDYWYIVRNDTDGAIVSYPQCLPMSDCYLQSLSLFWSISIDNPTVNAIYLGITSVVAPEVGEGQNRASLVTTIYNSTSLQGNLHLNRTADRPLSFWTFSSTRVRIWHWRIQSKTSQGTKVLLYNSHQGTVTLVTT